MSEIKAAESDVKDMIVMWPDRLSLVCGPLVLTTVQNRLLRLKNKPFLCLNSR